jgi:hypothetical protein
MYSQIRIFLSEFQTNLCFSDASHSVQQERLSMERFIRFDTEVISEFRQVVSASGEIRARRSPQFIFNLW